jgi:GT2 family glycosyltransferase
MNIIAVVVTYGNRFNFLQKVIASCLDEGVNKVVVVDNNSKRESKRKLMELESEIGDKLEVMYLDINTGSSGGFKTGIETALKDIKCEFIWLLDDDNKPEPRSLEILKEYWLSLKKIDKQNNTALLSYRPKKANIGYLEAVLNKNPDLVLGGRINSFLGFHLIDLPTKIIKKLMAQKQNKTELDNNIGLVSVAPYGGLFFHKHLIQMIGFPDESYFVYADDHEWSYRITKYGGEIILLQESSIEDIDVSWNSRTQYKTHFMLLIKGMKSKVYYSTRNRMFFEILNRVDSKFVYYCNIITYSLILFFFSLIHLRITNYKIFLRAIKDGWLKNKNKAAYAKCFE